MLAKSSRFRPAFTMIELMTAIVIIVILAGILLVGLRSVMGGSKAASTKVALETASGMLAELDAVGKLNSPPVGWYYGQSYNSTTTRTSSDSDLAPSVSQTITIDFWHVLDRTTSSPDYPLPLANPGNMEGVKVIASVSTTPYALKNTAIVMGKLIVVPANRSKIQGLPPQDVWLSFKLSPLVGGGQYPVLLDAWGNPIIYVPACGLNGVKLSGSTNPRLITSTTIRDPIANPTDYANITAGDRPFFASAGPDGDFSTGDDNIYSFEK